MSQLHGEGIALAVAGVLFGVAALVQFATGRAWLSGDVSGWHQRATDPFGFWLALGICAGLALILSGLGWIDLVQP